jgi:pimeloyl-ACP methyl ester carboxylesterase
MMQHLENMNADSRISSNPSARGQVTAQEAYERFFRPSQRSPTATEQQVIEQAVCSRVASRGVALAVYGWGAGPTVLLVHGWGGCGAQLTTFAPPLLHAGFRVMACDLPAHGQTAGTQTNGFEFAEAIQAIADQDGPFAGIIAHSWGAAGALMALSEGVAAQRVVCLSSACWLLSSVRMHAKLLRLSPETESELRQLIELNFGEGVWQRASMDLRVSQLRTPGLLFHDGQDRMISPTESEAIAQAWSGSNLVLTSGLGHNRILQNASVIDRAVAFIKGEINL